MNDYKSKDNDSSKDNDCFPVLGRRRFLKYTGVGVGALMAFGKGFPVMAGPFEANDFESLVPADKKLSKAWVRSLTERGEPEVFSGWVQELKYIGMPIGGIGCGQLYLGGDGRLWLWDIFKSNYDRERDHGRRIDAFTLGGHYAHPVAFGEEYTKYNGTSVEQGFLIRAKSGGKSFTRTLDKEGFPGVTFRGESPIGLVTYEDVAFPIKVELEAFSPFIPLNARDSALPATVMRFTVTNAGGEAMDVDFGGWLQNATCPYQNDPALGYRLNRLVTNEGRCSVVSTVEPSANSSAGIQEKHGYGSMALSVLLDEGVNMTGASSLKDPDSPEGLFSEIEEKTGEPVAMPLDQLLVGGLRASLSLQPGESKTITFLITWYFPYHLEQTSGQITKGITNFKKLSRHYRPWFDSAGEVADYIATHREHLIGGTLRWNRTWYDSTLPFWLLDRSMIALNCISTQTFHWFDSGRPYSWEGVDCCPGTCTHVFHYAQALGRIFPELERAFREEVDYKPGIGFHPQSGLISARGDFNVHEATDGQAGTILRVYREHQMSADAAFLTRLWPRVKKSIEFLIAKDPEEDGLIDGRQPHTLDAAWYGPMAWMSGIYLAALAAGEQMALEMGDADFAQRCRRIVDNGSKRMVSELFDGEYFIHKPDLKQPKALRTGPGCHIDQVLGQAWAHQVGLGRVIPKKETVSALNSLWKYNFSPDAGQYALDHIQIDRAFRWYAMPGEAGLLMTTWPKGGAMEAIPGDRLRAKKNPEVWTGPGGYFNECMNGFEYQVAWHMVAEGEPGSELVQKGLAVAKAVHERYGAARRNPYNEIECSDHYARSMASYGIYLAACGFEYHGPKGYLSFAPRISPENFRAAFTAAESWGTYSQKQVGKKMEAEIIVRNGRLALSTIALEMPADAAPSVALVMAGGQTVPCTVSQKNEKTIVDLKLDVVLSEDQFLTVSL